MKDDWLSLSGKQRRAFTAAVAQVHGWNCCICGLPIKPGEESCEHLVPRSRGGLTTLANCRLAHRRCNSARGNRKNDGPAGGVESGRKWFG